MQLRRQLCLDPVAGGIVRAGAFDLQGVAFEGQLRDAQSAGLPPGTFDAEALRAGQELPGRLRRRRRDLRLGAQVEGDIGAAAQGEIGLAAQEALQPGGQFPPPVAQRAVTGEPQIDGRPSGKIQQVGRQPPFGLRQLERQGQPVLLGAVGGLGGQATEAAVAARHRQAGVEGTVRLRPAPAVDFEAGRLAEDAGGQIEGLDGQALDHDLDRQPRDREAGLRLIGLRSLRRGRRAQDLDRLGAQPRHLEAAAQEAEEAPIDREAFGPEPDALRVADGEPGNPERLRKPAVERLQGDLALARRAEGRFRLASRPVPPGIALQPGIEGAGRHQQRQGDAGDGESKAAEEAFRCRHFRRLARN